MIQKSHRRTIGVLLTIVLTFVSAGQVAHAATRSGQPAWKWPFKSDSPWNVPIGGGAQFEDNLYIHQGNNAGDINWNGHNGRIARAVSTSPQINMVHWVGCYNNQNPANFPVLIKIPTGTEGGDPQFCDADRVLVVVQPNGSSVNTFWNCEMKWETTPQVFHASIHVPPNSLNNAVTGTGWGSGSTKAGTSASGCSNLGGGMRSWEVNGTGHQRMKHVLRAGMDADQLRKPTLPGGAWKWPAISADGSAATTYKGEIFVGDLLAIPKPGKPDGILYSDIPGLSEDGKALAWTLQNYGVYITDTAGGTPAIRYWAPEDNVAYNVTKINAMKADLQKIHQYLRRVKNNTPTTIGGGGSRPTGLWPLDEPTP